MLAENFVADLVVKPRPEAFSLPAFAKINLELHVLGKRPDGMHEIRTLLQTISLHDLLTFTPCAEPKVFFACCYSDEAGESGQLQRADVPADNSNIVYKAAELLREFVIEQKLALDLNQLGANILLEKRIPSSAGLGGGSSDAAVTLIGLSKLWSLKISKEQLIEIAKRLGSDVPFFLSGGKALGTGTGAIIKPIEDDEESIVVDTVDPGPNHFKNHHLKYILIISPPVKISTAVAYEMLSISRLTKKPRAGKLSVSSSTQVASAESTSDSDDESFRNDFESVILPAYPETMFARDALIEAGAQVAHLCGSGSSVYGIFDNKDLSNKARVLLERLNNWSVSECRTISKIEYKKDFGFCAEFLV